jgi:hypothetical protein
MKSDEVSALYPAEGEYKIENPFPTEGAPLMLTATPKEGATGLAKTFGFLEGELVYCMAGGKMTEDEFNAKVEEYKKIYGEPAKDAPQFLKDTEFWSGTKKETTEGTAPEGTETKVTEGGEPTEAGDSGMGADLPKNAVFWVDELNKLVLLGGIEEGDAGFFLMRADKIDEQFKAYEKAMDDMINKAMPDAKAGGTTTPPAEGGK